MSAANSKVVYCHCREGQPCDRRAYTEAKSEEEHRGGPLPRLEGLSLCEVGWALKAIFACSFVVGIGQVEEVQPLLAGRRSTRLSSPSTVPKAHQSRPMELSIHDLCLEFGNLGGSFLLPRCAKAHIAAEGFCTTLRCAIETFKNSWRPSCSCNAQNLKLAPMCQTRCFVDPWVHPSAESDTHASLSHAADMVVREDAFARNVSASGLFELTGPRTRCCGDTSTCRLQLHLEEALRSSKERETSSAWC